MSGTCASTLKEHVTSKVPAANGMDVTLASLTSRPRARARSSMPGDRSMPFAVRAKRPKRSSRRPVPTPHSRTSPPRP